MKQNFTFTCFVLLCSALLCSALFHPVPPCLVPLLVFCPGLQWFTSVLLYLSFFLPELKSISHNTTRDCWPHTYSNVWPGCRTVVSKSLRLSSAGSFILRRDMNTPCAFSFHARYTGVMPQIPKAFCVSGVVFVPSFISSRFSFICGAT